MSIHFNHRSMLILRMVKKLNLTQRNTES